MGGRNDREGGLACRQDVREKTGDAAAHASRFFGGHAPDSVTELVANWNRSSSCWVMCPSKQQSAISAANDSAKPLTTDSASNPSFELKRAGSSPAPFQLPGYRLPDN